MKKHLFIPAIVAVCLSACGPVYVVQDPTPPPSAPAPQPGPAPEYGPQPEEASYQTFYDQLSPYGQWIDDPHYGYVWLPYAGPDFKPYATNGHWVYTDEGWTWNSGYPWGWAAFHYGRWYFQDGYGWMWVPGNEWAPAWVTWRNSDEYYGWAPLGPNVSINIAIGGGYAPPPHYWCFVPHQYVASPQINNYYVRESNNVTIINQTTVINNYNINNTTINNTTVNNNNTTLYNNIHNHYSGGPDPREVGRFTGTPVRPMTIRESRTPGEQTMGGSLAIYRPRVNAAPAASRPGNGFARPAPARVQTLDNIQPANRTNTGFSNNPANQQGNSQPFNRPGSQPFGRPVNPQVNNQPVNNPPANNPNFARPGAPGNNGWNNNPPANRGNTGYSNNPANQPANQPVNNQPFNRPGAQPFNRPVYNPPVNNPPAGQPVNQPAAQPQQFQPRPAFARPFAQPNNNNPQARPVMNSPQPAMPQRMPPPQRRDDGRKDN